MCRANSEPYVRMGVGPLAPLQIAETERLALRRLVPGDAEFLCRLLNEPSWLQNIGDQGVRTPLDAEQYIQDKFIGSYESLGYGVTD
jgi:[ribosomal protein S5]-alanine N-acetyltransferase